MDASLCPTRNNVLLKWSICILTLPLSSVRRAWWRRTAPHEESGEYWQESHLSCFRTGSFSRWSLLWREESWSEGGKLKGKLSNGVCMQLIPLSSLSPTELLSPPSLSLCLCSFLSFVSLLLYSVFLSVYYSTSHAFASRSTSLHFQALLPSLRFTHSQSHLHCRKCIRHREWGSTERKEGKGAKESTLELLCSNWMSKLQVNKQWLPC